MKMLGITALAAIGIIFATVHGASAQWVRPSGVSRAGDPICPSNYVFNQGWCKALYGSGGPGGGYGAGGPGGYGGGRSGPGGYGGDGNRGTDGGQYRGRRDFGGGSYQGQRQFGGGDGGYYDPRVHPYGPSVPVAPGGRCPSNYVIRGGMCRPYTG